MASFLPPGETESSSPRFVYPHATTASPAGNSTSPASANPTPQDSSVLLRADSDSPPPPGPALPQQADPNGPPQFAAPLPDGSSRVWFMTAADAPIATSCATKLMEHGDRVIAGVDKTTMPERGRAECRAQLEAAAQWTPAEGAGTSGTEGGRCVVVDLDPTSIASVQAAVARGVAAFGKIDVLYVSTATALVGTVEELGQSPETQGLVGDCFRTNFFGAVNMIKASLPHMRGRGAGHIILLTGITGHLGTPGLGAYCASQWAIEGYCDSLAFEVAPFGIRVSVVQSNIEVGLLTGRITSVPPMKQYGIGAWKSKHPAAPAARSANRAPLARGWMSSVLSRLEAACGSGENSKAMLTPTQAASFYAELPAEFEEALIAETVFAICSIGGHENPPARHIVGHEGIASVKEKLKTVSEELEEFVGVSGSVDF